MRSRVKRKKRRSKRHCLCRSTLSSPFKRVQRMRMTVTFHRAAKSHPCQRARKSNEEFAVTKKFMVWLICLRLSKEFKR
jgi:hypothetical protein